MKFTIRGPDTSGLARESIGIFCPTAADPGSLQLAKKGRESKKCLLGVLKPERGLFLLSSKRE